MIATFNFLYVTDTHLYDRGPRSRTDDYLEAGLRKLGRVLEYANVHGVDVVVVGGDVFGRGSAHARHLAWGAWRRVAERIEEHGHVRWYMNVGQHDLDAHRHESLWEMPLGALSLLPNVHILLDGIPMEIGRAATLPILVWGRWFDFRAAQTPDFYRLELPENFPPSFRILTAHGLLVPETFVGPHVLLSDVGVSDADLFLASDYHPGWKTRKSKVGRRTTYIAPGSMMRTEKPSEPRTPKLVHVSVRSDGTFEWQTHELATDHPFRSELPGAVHEHIEADSLEGIAEVMAREGEGIRFVDPVEHVSQLAVKGGVPDAVRERALDYVGRATKMIGGKE